MPNPWLNEHESTAAMNYFLNNILFWGNVKSNIFNRHISDEPTKSLGIKTENMPRAVVPLVRVFSCLAYDWVFIEEWEVTWHDTKLDVDRC